MVSKRQRLARKRFKEANPDLFPPAAAAAAGGGEKTKVRKNKSKFKRKKAKEGKAATAVATRKSGGGGAKKKHPLRVPGMRPGESCFICRSGGHIAKLCPEKAQWEKNKICLLCRERGHSLKNCPEKGEVSMKKFCYNCGETGHSLSKCPKPIENGGTKFASCFICKEHGHLSKNCPENKHGIYPKGGSCKICGGVTHLAKHCPNKGKQDLLSSGDNAAIVEESQQEGQAVRRSGDDLEDDFIQEEAKTSKSPVTSHPNSKSAAETGDAVKNIHAKPKAKQGPKVVKFFG